MRRAFLLLSSMAAFLAILIASYFVGRYTWFSFRFADGAPTIRLAWLAVLALLSVFALRTAVRTVRRVRRSLEGRCLRCGYDVRAADAMCPECGDTVERITSNPAALAERRTTAICLTGAVVLASLLSSIPLVSQDAFARVYLTVTPLAEKLKYAWSSRVFNAELWKASTASVPYPPDPNPRADMVDDLLEKHPLVGLTEAEVLDLLGPPDERKYYDAGDFAYVLGTERGFIRMDPTYLILRFNGDRKVAKVIVSGL